MAALAEKQAANKHKLEKYHQLKVSTSAASMLRLNIGLCSVTSKMPCWVLQTCYATCEKRQSAVAC